MSAPYLYSDYLHSDHWQFVRRQALDLADWRCLRCGEEGALEVHHRTYYDDDGSVLWREQSEHLVVLCRGCHEAYHEAERAWLRVVPPEIIHFARRFDNRAVCGWPLTSGQVTDRRQWVTCRPCAVALARLQDREEEMAA